MQSLFRKIFLLHRKVDFCQNCKFSNKNYHFCAQRNFKQKNCDACSYNKWNLKPQISPIFHFEYVNPVWISGVVGVKKHTILGTHNFVLRTYKISLLKNIQMEFLILVHCEQYVLGLHSGTPSYLAKFFIASLQTYSICPIYWNVKVNHDIKNHKQKLGKNDKVEVSFLHQIK